MNPQAETLEAFAGAANHLADLVDPGRGVEPTDWREVEVQTAWLRDRAQDDRVRDLAESVINMSWAVWIKREHHLRFPGRGELKITQFVDGSRSVLIRRDRPKRVRFRVYNPFWRKKPSAPPKAKMVGSEWGKIDDELRMLRRARRKWPLDERGKRILYIRNLVDKLLWGEPNAKMATDLRMAVAEVGPGPPAAEFNPTSDDSRVLDILAKCHPKALTQDEILKALPRGEQIGEKKLGLRLKLMRAAGIVVRPTPTSRYRDVITERGLEIQAKQSPEPAAR